MISAEEAILIMRGWCDRSSELLLSGTMIGFSVYCKCRVVAVDGNTVTFWSSKDDAVFALDIAAPPQSIRYSELRELKGKPGLELLSEAQMEKSALVVTLPFKLLNPTVESGDAEQIMLLEI